ncbi:MAG: hypothetical protein CL910_05550 [Deltaproteobacteria bacterium]|jgi:uncharacterized ferritin-like protein (DUF455 family)|nr:hypothetical protein [Deltaproteobacteria bacterium]
MSAEDLWIGCLRILESGDLAAKLAPIGDRGFDAPPPGRSLDAPRRGAGLEMSGGQAPLPRPASLGDAEARALCLARFAHHEIQAVELFAWALLRWPGLPDPVLRGFARILGEEQRHARGYLSRLAALGFQFADFAPHSDYFWKHVPGIDRPEAFLAAVGLTLEQANLDFSLIYRDAFRAAGDEESARVCEEVHEDEIGHVSFAAESLRALQPGGCEIDRYEQAVPFPLGAARAKARRFDRRARERAGLGSAFIEHVRVARSSQERASDPREPT